MSYYIVPNESETVLSGLSLYYDSMYVSSGGTASNTTLTHGGSMYVSSGGTATETTLYYGGSMYVCSSGLADNTTVNGGTLIVSSSGLADNTTINTGVLQIYSGGTADNTTANLGGGLYISSGGTATKILENGGNVAVYSGATATFIPNVINDLVVSDSCHITIHSGTTAVNASMQNASMFVYSGGTATGTVLNWGLLRVNDGLAENTVVNSAARIEVSSGGVANNTTVNSGGSVSVYTGASADGVSIASGGLLCMVNGGSATGVAAEDGVILYVYLATETCLTGTSGGKDISISEGNLNGLEFGSSGTLVVSNYVTATSAVVGPGARMIIDSYGSAADIVENGGNVILNGGNPARVTFKENEFKDVVLEDSGTYYGTTATVHSGTTATNTTIGGSAVMCVYSGGSVNSATVSAITISSGSSQYLRGGSMFVYSGGIADGVIRASELGKVTISSGAVVADGLQLIEDGGGFELDSDVEAAIVSRVIPNEFGGRTLSGLVTVHSGTTATDVTFTSGTFHLYSGGVLNNFTLSDANLVVHSGVELVSAVECSEYRGGTVTVESGAVVTGISRCNAVINGTVTNAIVGNGQRSYIRFDVGSGGKLISATAIQSGGIFVSSGGLVEDSILEYGWGRVYSGGSVKNMTLKDGDYDISGGVFDGGQGYGYLSVESGGSLKNLTLSGGGLAVRNATATDFTISNGSLGVYGGTATDFTLTGSASISFSVDPTDGTYISGTIMKGETPTTILIQDGKVNDLNMRGTIYLENGGTADNITFSGGNAVISSGCTATNLKFIRMESGGGVYVDSYGYLNGAIFESGTGLTMSYYASAANVSALGGGITMVDTCRIDNALIANGGVMSMLAYEGDAPVAVGIILSHGIVTSTYHDSYTDVDSTWTEDRGGRLVVYWNAIVSDTTVMEKGEVSIVSNGHASNTTLSSGGFMGVSGYGKASGVTVSSGGILQVGLCGIATDVTVLSGGRVFMVIDPDTHISGTYEGSAFAVDGTLTSAIGPGFSYEVESGGAITASTFVLDEGGRLEVHSGATFQGDLTVNRGCEAYLYYGTNASGTVLENGGWVYISDDANITFQSNTINDLQLTSGYSATVHSNTVASNTLVQGVISEDDGKWSELAVFGGVVYDTDVRENGYLYVSSGGSAFRTKVYTGGDLYLYESSFASDAVVTGSNALIEVGYSCTAVSATVNDHASMYVWDCGLVSSTTVSGGAIMGVYGGSSIDTVVLGGTMAVEGYYYSSSVCNASNTTVKSGGSMLVYSYGLASSVSLENGTDLTVSSGGTAVDVTIAKGGKLLIGDSGFVSGLTSAGGEVSVGASAMLTGETEIESGGRVVVSGSSSFMGGQATVFSSGAISVESGGTIAAAITVKTGGEVSVGPGGWLTGPLTVETGATVAMAEGSVFSFDISGISEPSDKPLLNDYSALSGDPEISITVSAYGQPHGTYILADNAAGFNETVTVYYDDYGTRYTWGELSLDSEPVPFGDDFYTLTLSKENQLILTVGDYIPVNGPEEPLNNYLYDKKQDPVLNTNVTEEYGNYFRTTHDEICLDQIGTVESASYHNHVGADDVTDFAKLTLEHGARVSFDLSATDATKFSVWSLTSGTDKKGNTTYKQKSKQATILKKPKGATTYSAQTKNLFLEAGVYYVSMQSTNAKKGGDALYNVTVNGDTSAKNYTIIYDDGDDGWNNYLYDKKKSPVLNPYRYDFPTTYVSSGTSNVRIDSSGVSHTNDGTTYTNFVGFGDAADFARVYLDYASSLSFTVTSTDAAKFTVWQLVIGTDKKGNTTYTQKNLQTTTLKKEKGATVYTADTKKLLLEDGYYYISVQSTNAKKGGNAYYNVEVNQPDCTYFFDGDGGWNDWLYDKKRTYEQLNSNIYYSSGQTIGTGTTSIYMDDWSIGHIESGITWDSFAGFGDSADFRKIRLDSDATLSFTLQATDATKFTIWRLIEGTDKKGNTTYTQKALQATTLKKAKGATPYEAETKALLLEAGTYYVSMESTNASKGGRAYYNVAVGSFTANDAVSSALEMPMAAAAYADSASDKLFGETVNGLLASL